MTDKKKQKIRAISAKTGMSHQAASNALQGKKAAPSPEPPTFDELFKGMLDEGVKSDPSLKILQEVLEGAYSKDSAPAFKKNPSMEFTRKWQNVVNYVLPQDWKEGDPFMTDPLLKVNRRGEEEWGIQSRGTIYWFPKRILALSFESKLSGLDLAKLRAFKEWFADLPESPLKFIPDPLEWDELTARVRKATFMEKNSSLFKAYLERHKHRFRVDSHRDTFFIPFSVMDEHDDLYQWWQLLPNGEALDLLAEPTPRALKKGWIFPGEVLKHYDQWKHLPVSSVIRHRDKTGRRIGVEVDGSLFWIDLTELKGKKEVFMWWRDTLTKDAVEKPVYEEDDRLNQLFKV